MSEPSKDTNSVKLTGKERAIVDRMKEGWTPFLIQLAETGRSLQRKGVVVQTFDRDNNGVYALADEWR